MIGEWILDFNPGSNPGRAPFLSQRQEVSLPPAPLTQCPAGVQRSASRDPIQGQAWTGALPFPRTTAAGLRSLPEQQGWVCPGFPPPLPGLRAQVSRLVTAERGRGFPPGGRGAHLLDLLHLLL